MSRTSSSVCPAKVVILFAAGLGPLVAALVVTSYEAGGAGRRALFRQLLRWRVPGPGSGQDAISFPVFVVSVTAAAILFTSLYNSTGGSLLVVILAHTIFDLCTTGPWARGTLPPDRSGLDPFDLLTIVVGIVAVGVVLATDPRTLTRRRRWGFHGNSALQP